MRRARGLFARSGPSRTAFRGRYEDLKKMRRAPWGPLAASGGIGNRMARSLRKGPFVDGHPARQIEG